MSRARGMRGARKMPGFVKDRVAAMASEDDLDAALARSGDRLLVVEFAAVRGPPAAREWGREWGAARTHSYRLRPPVLTRTPHSHGASPPRRWRTCTARWLGLSRIWA